MNEVRICPTCEVEHPPATLKCPCGQHLINVDITGSRSAEVLGSGLGDAEFDIPIQPGCCPYPDCGASNPIGAELCAYCFRPLNMTGAASSTLPISSAVICWPWGEEIILTGELRIGREPPASAAMASKLEREYVNVSRRHAEFIFNDNILMVRDLGSLNGTFVNDQPIKANQLVTLANGDRVRFAAHLTATITLK